MARAGTERNMKKVFPTRLAGELLIILLYLVSIALVRYPLIFQFSKGYYDGNRLDGGFYVWLVKNNIERVLTFPSQGYDLSFYYPFGNVLAYSDNFLLPSLATKLLLKASGSLLVSYNLTLLLALLLNGYITFCLARYLTKDAKVSFFCGFVFLFSPFFASHFTHPQLQFAFFLPGVLLACLVYLDTRHPFPALAIGLCILLAFFASIYLSLFCLLLAALTLLLGGILRLRSFRLRDLLLLLGLNLPAALLLLIAARPYIEVRRTFGPRSAAAVEQFSTDLFAYLAAPPGNSLWGSLTHTLAHGEAHLFSGGLTLLLVLAAVFFWRSWFKDRALHLAILLFLTFFFAWASLGLSTKNDSPFGLFYFLHQYVPGFNAIRVPSRLGIITQLCLILIAGFGLKPLLRIGQKDLSWRILLVLLLISSLELHHQGLEISKGKSPPPVYAELSRLSAKGAVISLPLASPRHDLLRFVHDQTEYMHWLYDSGRPVVNGYTGMIPQFHERLPSRLRGFPDPVSLYHLSRLPGLRYVVYHPTKKTKFNEEEFSAALAKHQDQLQLITRDSFGNYLLKFSPKLTQPETRLFLPPDTRHERSLSFRIWYVSKTYTEREVTLHIDPHADPGKNQKSSSSDQTYVLKPNDDWKTITLSIPKSPDPCAPHTLSASLEPFTPGDSVYFQLLDVSAPSRR